MQKEDVSEDGVEVQTLMKVRISALARRLESQRRNLQITKSVNQGQSKIL